MWRLLLTLAVACSPVQDKCQKPGILLAWDVAYVNGRAILPLDQWLGIEAWIMQAQDYVACAVQYQNSEIDAALSLSFLRAHLTHSDIVIHE